MTERSGNRFMAVNRQPICVPSGADGSVPAQWDTRAEVYFSSSFRGTHEVERYSHQGNIAGPEQGDDR